MVIEYDNLKNAIKDSDEHNKICRVKYKEKDFLFKYADVTNSSMYVHIEIYISNPHDDKQNKFFIELVNIDEEFKYLFDLLEDITNYSKKEVSNAMRNEINCMYSIKDNCYMCEVIIPCSRIKI